MDPNSIKQALAIAIVRQKRQLAREAESWRAKAQRLECQLTQQQLSYAKLQQWANTLLQGAPIATSTIMDATGREDDESPPLGMFLPPLTMQASYDSQGLFTRELYESLQQQLVLAGIAAGGASSKALVEVLDGKAAKLADMLLTNIQMLQSLHNTVSAGHGHNDATLKSSSQQDQVGETGPADQLTHAPANLVVQISSFFQETLLQTPNSFLRNAYMRRCASLLAALLAHIKVATPDQAQQQAVQYYISALGTSPQQQTVVEGTKQGQLVPAQIVQFMLHLVNLTLHGRHTSTDKPETAAKSTDLHQLLHLQDLGAAASARLMLQQLSMYPSTALLMTVAAARQLSVQVQELQHVNAALKLQLADSSNRLSTTACEAAKKAAVTFEHVHELFEQLDQAVTQLPTWVIAVVTCSWTSWALEGLVADISASYIACHDLQQHQPLCVVAICQLSASLATRLQHLATNTEAPGMQETGAAAVRSVCGRLCVRLRDMFMP